VNKLLRWYGKLRGRHVLPPGIRVGANVHIGDALRFDWTHGRHITIEDGATIAPGVRILCHDASSVRRTGGTWVAPVTIGAGAFVGAEAVLLPGVSIGAGAVVAAGAVVTKDVPSGTVVAGVPATVIATVADLDARRQDQMKCAPSFPSAVYGAFNLSDAQDEELRKAISQFGGYYLV
jgi:maltose O-acetyltransferase